MNNTLVCAYCNKPIKEGNITVDHILPKWLLKQAKCNYNVEGNLVYSCYVCNTQKGASIWLPTVSHCYNEFRWLNWYQIYRYAEFILYNVPYIVDYSSKLTSVPYEPAWLKDFEEVKLLWDKGWYHRNRKRKDRLYKSDGTMR